MAQEESSCPGSALATNMAVTIGHEFVVVGKTIFVKEEHFGEMLGLSPRTYEVKGVGLISQKECVFLNIKGSTRRFALETLKKMGTFQRPKQPILF